MSKVISFIVGVEFAWLWSLHEPALATWLVIAYVGLSIYHGYEMWLLEKKYNRK